MRTVLNFNAGWAFAKESQVPANLPADWEAVDLPHCWNAVDGQDGGNDYFRGTAYYAKQLSKAELPVAQQYYLEIQGANSSAEVLNSFFRFPFTFFVVLRIICFKF